MNWNQPKCLTCWARENPGREAVALIDGERETCSSCGMPTYSGIYVRQHPDDVRYPAQ